MLLDECSVACWLEAVVVVERWVVRTHRRQDPEAKTREEIDRGAKIEGPRTTPRTTGVEATSRIVCVSGIGMDDTFVLLAAWRRTDPSRSVEDRMKETYRHAGVSITITSLTNLLSFAIGATGPFSSMFIFCTYTAVSVVSTFIFQITFFGGLMALLGRAERENRHGLTLRPAVPRSQAGERSWAFRLLCTGGWTEEDSKVEPPHAGMVFFRDHIGGALSKPVFKVFVIVCFVLYLSVALYGCTQVKEGLETYNLFGSNSYAVEFFTHVREYFTKYPYRIQVVVNRTIDYSNPEEQEKIEAMLKDFESTPYTAGSVMSESWLRAFHRFKDHPSNRLWTSALNRTNKADFVRWIRYVFLRFPQIKHRFGNDFVFSSDRSEIIATRYIVQAKEIHDSNDAKHMVMALREIAAKHGASIFNTYFIYHDQLTMISGLTVQATGVTAAAMLAVTLTFLPRPSCVIWVALVIGSVEIGVVGFMTLWNVSLNSVSLLGLIMCIGFSVDNAAHVTYAYAIARGSTTEERLKDALFYVGLPIVQGSVSTILGVLALSAAPSYVFTTVFKTWFLVMVFSALHSLFLLPVLLSLIGSKGTPKNPSIDTNDNRIYSEENKENALPLIAPFQTNNIKQTEI
ncbi:daf-6 [Cordylochernes scorpioides]|uniref:Daf-6 n=1 Tax=Cordylochernes scorpioides TaxID=51811 RepID=A0ABY6KBI8_9ARAC|nr:daf-6 [Cordylochernes scorpioides]